MEKCQWKDDWTDGCKNPPIPNSGFCAEHNIRKCCSCGAKATRECGETGQFVCGADLCENCEHTTFPDGTNGGIGFMAQPAPEGMKRHCKKTEQKYKPWFTVERKTTLAGD